MQRLEVSGAVRPLQGSLGVKELSPKLCLTEQNYKHKSKLRSSNVTKGVTRLANAELGRTDS